MESTAPANAAVARTDGCERLAGRVLCVDDERNILNALNRLLRRDGHTVLTASSGASALELLAHEEVDVVISDMRMPGMDGAALLEAVRARWPDTMRLLLTGYADVAGTMAAINRGEIYRYVAKPWDDRDLQLVVRHALERRALAKEKLRLEALTRQQNRELQTLNAGLEEQVAARTQELEAANERLKKNFLASVRVFGNLIEMRSGAIAGHSQRVANLGWRLACALGVSRTEAQDVMLAGMLHDIGKLGLPDELHAKPFDQLSAQQRVLVMRHPEKGEAALMSVEQLAGAALLIRHHHELFNGTGYPRGIAGDEIPLGARILAVANEYDAICAGTLLSRRHGPLDAKAYVIHCRGKRYDPVVVDALLTLLERPEEDRDGPEAAIGTHQLRPGMTLSRNLTARDGMMLLARNYVLNEAVIRRIQAFERSEGCAFTVHVRTAAKEAGCTV